MTNRLLTLGSLLVALLSASPSFAAAKQRIALQLDYEFEKEQAEKEQAALSRDCPDAEQLGMMLAAEFGYPVVRSDASARLSVRIKQTPKGLTAVLEAPSPREEGALWTRTATTQGACHELAYDIATLVRAGLGPAGWPSEEVPEVLAAPPEPVVEQQRVEPQPSAPRLPQVLAQNVVAYATVVERPEPPKAFGVPLQVELSATANVMPYGLPGFAVGGGGMIQLRLPLVGLGMDIRGVTMVTKGFGAPEVDGRASLTSMSFPLCILSQHLDVCGTVGPSFLTVDAPPPVKIRFADGLSWGFGARLTVRYPLSKRFTFLGYADGNFQLWPVTIRTVSQEDPTKFDTIWQSPTLRVTLGAGIAYSMFE